MLNHVKHGCVLLFALPVVALASPVTVTSHATGLITIEPEVMQALGAYDFQGTGPLPYELTLTSTYDPGGPLPDRGMDASTGPIDVTIDFHVGDFAYHHAGLGSISTRLSTLDPATD